VTKYRIVGNLQTIINIFSQVLEAEMSRFKAPADSMPGESWSLVPRWRLSHVSSVEQEAAPLKFFYRVLALPMRALPHDLITS
jgi:hypothetical protein